MAGRRRPHTGHWERGLLHPASFSGVEWRQDADADPGRRGGDFGGEARMLPPLSARKGGGDSAEGPLSAQSAVQLNSSPSPKGR